MNTDPTALVTGGAGYIGSHTVLALIDAGWRVVVLDDLSTGSRDLVPESAAFIRGDVADNNLVRSILRERNVDAVLHFAGSIVVPESVIDPIKYYANNTVASENLISACLSEQVNTFVFSSTAAIYGEADNIPVSETAALRPANPYGRSKVVTEWMLQDVAAATSLRYAALRYFNVAGADLELRTGQATPNATHLIKIACETAVGKRNTMSIFGDDYETRDGTCVRDYIHVSDLACAHVKALEHISAHRENLVLNCGYGTGYTVREIIDAVEERAGVALNVDVADRRDGDVAALIADNQLLMKTLDWQPKFGDIGAIIQTALDWERKLIRVPLGLEEF